ncbi:MAG: NUDIX hydrolase [Actinomycetota bacterium]
MTRVPAVGVGGIALQGGSILLVQRGTPPSEGLWSVPGGRLEWSETMAEAVRREVAEETGLEVAVGEVAGVVERIYEGFHYVIVDYFVTVTGGTLRAGGDVRDARWVPVGEVEALPLAPGLADALRGFGSLP